MSADSQIEQERVERLPFSGEMVIGRSILVWKMLQYFISLKSELVVSQLPLSRALRVLKAEKAELVTGRSSVLDRTDYHGDKSELVVSQLPLSEVLRVLKAEKAELVTGKGRKS